MADRAQILIEAVYQASGVLDKIERKMGSVTSVVDKLKYALGGLGAAVSVGAFANMIEGAIDAQDALYKLSQRTGITVETLSGLRLIAKQSGTDMDTVGTVVNRLEKTMMQFATEPTKQLQVAFGALGISQKQAEEGLRNIDTFLPELARRLTETGTASQQAALAQTLFGRAGAQLLPFLHQLAEAGKINAEVTTEQGKRAQDFKDKLEALEHQVELLKESLGNKLLPTLTDIAEALNKAKESAAGLYGALGAAFASHSIPEDIPARLHEINAELDKLKQAPVLPGFLPGAASLNAIRGADIGRLEAERSALLAAQRDQALKWAQGLGDTGDQVSRRFQRPLNLSGLLTQPEKSGPAGPDPLIERYEEMRRILLQADKEGEALEAQDAKRARALAEQNKLLDEQAQHWRDIIDPLEPYRRQLDEIDKLYKAGKLDADEYWKANDKITAAMDQLGQKSKSTNDIAQQLGLTMKSAFEDAVIKGKSLRDVLKGIDQDIAQIIVRKSITEPLGNAVAGAVSSSGIGSFFSNIFGGLFGGGKASGGPVSAGTPYLIGESGPELFVPSSSGSVVPNKALAGGGETNNLNITFQVNSLDPRTAAAVLVQNEPIITALVQRAWNRRGYVTPTG